MRFISSGVIELKVDEGILLKRIEKRVTEMTARGEKVRADDNPDVLKGRLNAYRAQTAPLAGYYDAKGLLKAVDGMAPIGEVTAAIDRVLAGAAAKKPAQAAKRSGGMVKRSEVPAASGPVGHGSRSKNSPGEGQSTGRRRLTKAR